MTASLVHCISRSSWGNFCLVHNIIEYLIGDGAHFHSHPSLSGQLLGHRVAEQSKSMANTGSVEQESVQQVLVHIRALEICFQEK